VTSRPSRASEETRRDAVNAGREIELHSERERERERERRETGER